MRKIAFFLLVVMLPITAAAQSVITDIGYYSIEAVADGDTEDEAVANAVDLGVSRIFASLHKDSLFKDMFLSSWPESVILVSQETIPFDSGFEARAIVKIDRNAVLLAEPNYRNAVQTRLNQSELTVVKIEGILANAASAEENGETEKAGTLYSQGNDALTELAAITGNIQDESVLSKEGNSIEYFRSRIKGFESIVESGLARLDLVRSKEEKNLQTGEALSTYGPLKNSLNRLEREHTALSSESPFFGLSEEELEDAVARCSAAIETLQTQLLPKYVTLKDSMDATMQSLEAKIDLDIDRIDVLHARFSDMKNLAQKELSKPKSERMAEEQEKTEKSAQLKEKLMWMLVHPPRDRFVIRITPDIGFADGEVETPGFGLGLSAEKAFESGVWARAKLGYISEQGFRHNGVFPSAELGTSPGRKDILSSQLAIGFHTSTLYGVGFGWQWDNSYADHESFGEGFAVQEPRFYPSVFWGRVDKKRGWPTFLAEYSYGIPSSIDFPDPMVLLNGHITLILRGDDFLLFEAEGWSMPSNLGLPQTLDLNSDASQDHLYIYQGIKLSAGLRIPGPFTWGLSFTGTREALFESKELQDFNSMRWVWGMFFQYSI